MFTLYELSCLENISGPLVTKSIELKSDFTWTVSYKGHLVSHRSQVLHNLPSVANTGKYLCVQNAYTVSLTLLIAPCSAKAYGFNQLGE